ncbi:MAG TPA: acylphosphatase [Longimicrobiales bacterium]|nr:acylphosphatase [Longimicrobiales bacterium]
MNDNTRVRMVVSGQVQGVGFRAFIRRQTRGLRLDGYVRNLEDGTVEIEAAGPAADVARLRAVAAKGPPWATVSGVREVEPGDGNLPSPFTITR